MSHDVSAVVTPSESKGKQWSCFTFRSKPNSDLIVPPQSNENGALLRHLDRKEISTVVVPLTKEKDNPALVVLIESKV